MDAISHSADVAFRKLGYAADELLDCLTEYRAGAEKSFQNRLPFDWKTAAEKLQMLDDGLSFYLEPVKPALRKTTPGKMLTVAKVDGKTALHVLHKVSRNTIGAFWVFLNMTGKGAKKLVVPRQQRAEFEDAGWLASIVALSRSEVRELRKHLEREIDDAHETALADASRHPGEVARRKYGGERLPRYWSDIGYQPSANGKQQPQTKGRGLNVQKVQGSERRFRVCGEAVTVSAKEARILDAIVSLQADCETINPKNVMLKSGYDNDKVARRRFECDKGRLNKVLIGKVGKGFYVKDDGAFRLQKPSPTRNKKTARKR